MENVWYISGAMGPPQVQLTVQSNGRVIGLRAQQVIDCMFANPDWDQKKIAKTIGITSSRVSHILRSERALAALPRAAKYHIRTMVPKATQSYRQLMKQNVNLEVKRKVATSVLESEHVLEPSPTVTVNVMQSLTDDELLAKINRSVELPSKTIQGELA